MTEENIQPINQFSYLSYDITKQLNSDIIKNNGIYFTPHDVIKICIEKIIASITS